MHYSIQYDPKLATACGLPATSENWHEGMQGGYAVLRHTDLGDTPDLVAIAASMELATVILMASMELAGAIRLDASGNSYAEAKWIAEDIIQRRPKWDTDRAEAFLESIESDIREATIEKGWDVIDARLAELDE